MILETIYPISFRKNEATELGQMIKNRQSVVIIGMKRVGISNFLRFFLYHKEIIPTYISTNNHHLFIPIDLNDLVEREMFPFWVLTLKRIYDKAEQLPLDEKTKKHIETLFLNSIQSQDLFLVIDNIRSALRIIIDAGYMPTIFFLRFDRVKDILSPEFFANLRGLKDAFINRLSFVFTSYRSLDALSPNVFEKTYLTVFAKNLYVKPALHEDMEIIYNTYKANYDVELGEEVKNELLRLCGGYVRYLQLALLILQEQHTITSANELVKLLSIDERITLQSEELWESFTETEKTILLEIDKKHKHEFPKSAFEYLENTGVIKKNNSDFVIFSPLLDYFIRQQGQKTSVPSDFTKKEQLLFDVLETSQSEICDRETIIEAVWPEVEALGVSDWAIDRLVARVRTKLKLQKSTYEIQTIKTRGYKLTSK